MITEALGKVLDRKSLSRAEMAQVMGKIADGEVKPAVIGALLAALRMKGETAEEIAGAAEVMRARATRVNVRREVFVDTCGTGGDGAHTFNISTASALVAAGAGVTVAKHGNRSVSSRCGSADVLAALGVRLDLPAPKVEACIAEVGIGFLFAPAHHPAFSNVAALRRELGVRTLFNLLGPLSNPAGARHQVLGVFAPQWLPLLGRALLELGSAHVLVVHGSGLDEISVSGPTQVCEAKDGQLRELELTPEALGLSCHPAAALAGGDAADNARIIQAVLAGEKGARRDAVLANAAAALVVAGLAGELREGVELAARSIDSGAAAQKLSSLVQFTAQEAA